MFAYLLLLAQAAPPLVLPPQSVPPAAMQPPTILREPQERMPAPRYVSPDDYPAAAVGSGARGIVGFTLTVSPDGRVIGCNITRSSEWAILDAATCNLMRRRARYTPAMDSSGNPVVGTIAQEIEWKAQSR